MKTKTLYKVALIGLLNVSVPAMAMTYADGGAKFAPAGVGQIYEELEKMYNSPEFLKDSRIALPYFAEDMLLYDIEEPEQYSGQAFRDRWVKAGNSYKGTYNFLEMTIHGDDRFAFVSYIQEYTDKTADGRPFVIRMRTTDGLQKINGKWKIVNSHISAPLTSRMFHDLVEAGIKK